MPRSHETCADTHNLLTAGPYDDSPAWGFRPKGSIHHDPGRLTSVCGGRTCFFMLRSHVLVESEKHVTDPFSSEMTVVTFGRVWISMIFEDHPI